MLEAIKNFLSTTGIATAVQDPVGLVKLIIMYCIIGVLFYLAIARKFEPLLLLPIAFGMLLANLPGAEMMHMEYFIAEDLNYSQILHGGLIDILYLGVKLGIYPSLIFMGVGAMT
ncbi:MAG: sodium ion-translocating decarboxylase subunit beta, partial [Eubacteriales bacterium]